MPPRSHVAAVRVSPFFTSHFFATTRPNSGLGGEESDRQRAGGDWQKDGGRKMKNPPVATATIFYQPFFCQHTTDQRPGAVGIGSAACWGDWQKDGGRKMKNPPVASAIATFLPPIFFATTRPNSGLGAVAIGSGSVLEGIGKKMGVEK